MTAKRRQTLQQRVISRWEKEKFKQWDSALAILNIRAEFDRLARQIQKELRGVHANTVSFKKSKDAQDYILYERGLAAEGTLKDVLDMIEAQKR